MGELLVLRLAVYPRYQNIRERKSSAAKSRELVNKAQCASVGNVMKLDMIDMMLV